MIELALTVAAFLFLLIVVVSVIALFCSIIFGFVSGICEEHRQFKAKQRGQL